MAVLSRRAAIGACALVTLLVAPVRASAGAGDVGVPEAHVKAGFLYNFALFVEWPDDAFAGRAEVEVCVAGPDPVLAGLEALRTRSVNKRRVIVRQLTELDDPRTCHVLFFPAIGEAWTAGLLPALARAPVLTVGEDERFTRSGGAIRLFIENARPRFEINLTGVERARLRVSSKMLALAQVIREEGHALAH
jgi:hypothetical protein